MHLRLLKLFYDMAYAEARQRAGLGLDACEQHRLASLRELIGGDPGWRRRTHRRLPLELAATLRQGAREDVVTVSDMSAGGAAVRTERALVPGSRLQLKVHGDDHASYVFPCVVSRVEVGLEGCRLALAFDGIPLELRRHKHCSVELPQQLFRAAS